MEEKKQKKRKLKSQCTKKIQETGEKCLGSLVLFYEDNYPIFICEKCGERYETWKKFYEEYLHLYKTMSNWDEEKNKVSCILGFFCFKYKNRYKVDYTFVPKNINPFGLKEIRDIRVMLATFNNNAREVGKYLKWAFDKGLNSNVTITSLAYLNTENIIRKYKLYAEKNNSYFRHTVLPESFINWCKENAESIFKNYNIEIINDLGAILQYVNKYDVNSNDSVEMKVINKAKEFGFIKNNQLNIAR